VKTLFAQYVTGFVGASTDHRGRNADQDAVFSLIELQDLLDEWIVTGFTDRRGNYYTADLRRCVAYMFAATIVARGCSRVLRTSN
jgi:hypothetical protein